MESDSKVLAFSVIHPYKDSCQGGAHRGKGDNQLTCPPTTGLASLSLLDSALHPFAAAMQGMVASGVSVVVPPPSKSSPIGKVTTLSLLYLCFVCMMVVDGDLPTIWEAVAQGKGRMEGLDTLNQYLMRGLPSCHQVFGGRLHLGASLPLVAFIKNVSLLNPYLDPDFTGGGFTP